MDSDRPIWLLNYALLLLLLSISKDRNRRRNYPSNTRLKSENSRGGILLKKKAGRREEVFLRNQRRGRSLVFGAFSMIDV